MTDATRRRQARLLRSLGSVGLLALLLSNLLVFAPLSIYAGNASEFSVSLLSLWKALLAPAAAVLVFTGALTFAVPSLASARAQAVLAALVVLTWLQGAILVWDYGVFDGSPISWLETGWRGVLDTALWLALLLAAVYGTRRVRKGLIMAAAATLGIQAIAAAVELPTSMDAVSADNIQAFDPGSLETIAGFSSGRNIIHFVMDGFQSDIFADIVGDPERRPLAESLEGFTFFANHTGSFPYTQMTMPLLVSGRVYRNQVPVEAFTESAMTGDTVLNAAHAAGYDVDLAMQMALLNVYGKNRYTNAYPVPVNLHASRSDYLVTDLARMIDLVLFRASPHFVKAYVYQDELWLVQRMVRDGSFVNLRYFAELEFLRQLREAMVVDRDVPVYKLFHLMLSHRPTVGNAECEYDGQNPTNRHFVTLQSACGLEAVTGVLEQMKSLGIYDDALIVLMADHGAWVGPRGYDQNGEGGGPKAATAGLALPLLAIKPPGAGGPLTLSSAPTTIGDVPATIASLAGLDLSAPGANVFQLPEGGRRVRTFYDYAYGANRKDPGYLYTMLEYEIDGNPTDRRSWRPARRHLPGGAAEPAGP